jgi:hypothetical protein
MTVCSGGKSNCNRYATPKAVGKALGVDLRTKPQRRVSGKENICADADEIMLKEINNFLRAWIGFPRSFDEQETSQL